MTRDDVIRMARESGYVVPAWRDHVEQLERFAALVSAAEREACAQAAKAISDKYAVGHYGNEVDTADEIAAAIRARGAA